MARLPRLMRRAHMLFRVVGFCVPRLRRSESRASVTLPDLIWSHTQSEWGPVNARVGQRVRWARCDCRTPSRHPTPASQGRLRRRPAREDVEIPSSTAAQAVTAKRRPMRWSPDMVAQRQEPSGRRNATATAATHHTSVTAPVSPDRVPTLESDDAPWPSQVRKPAGGGSGGPDIRFETTLVQEDCSTCMANEDISDDWEGAAPRRVRRAMRAMLESASHANEIEPDESSSR